MLSIEEINKLQEENERLKKENEILLGQLVINDGEDVTVQISKSQFDEYNQFKDMAKKGLEEFKDVGGCWGCGLQLQLYQDMEDIKQLKAENERLKEEIKQYKKYKFLFEKAKEFKEKTDKWASECLAENEDLKDTIKRTVCQAECFRYKQANKYKQTLQEIKEISEKFCNACKEFEPDKCKVGNCQWCNYNRILQKIVECEVE